MSNSRDVSGLSSSVCDLASDIAGRERELDMAEMLTTSETPELLSDGIQHAERDQEDPNRSRCHHRQGSAQLGVLGVGDFFTGSAQLIVTRRASLSMLSRRL